MGGTAEGRERALVWFVGTIAAVSLVWLLRQAAVVAIPIAFAFFLAVIVHPVQLRLHGRLGRFQWAALPLTMLLIVAVLGGAVWATAESVDEALEAAPQYADELERLRASATGMAQEYGLTLPGFDGGPDLAQRLGDFATPVLRGLWSLTSGLVLVFFLVLLMLLEAPIWSENTRRVLRDRRAKMALDTVAEIAEKVRQYLWLRTLLGLMSAAAAGVWLLATGVDLVLVWVVLTFALNYIPNFGSIIAVIPPSLMAALQQGPVRGLVVLIGLAVIEQIIGNFIDPRMQGRRLQLSPTVVLVSLVFWTWLWGPAGALLAVPMTVTLLAAASHVPALNPFVTLVAAEQEAPSSRGRRDAA